MTFNQETMHQMADTSYHTQMHEKYNDIVNKIEKAAKEGKFSLEIARDKIKVECIIWLNDKGFEIYLDTGNNGEWENIHDFYLNVYRAKKVLIVW